MSEQKKKFSPLFLLVHLSLQPHFLSHTMDLLQRPSFLIDFVGNRKKKREKRGGKLSLLFLCRRFILSLVREDLSLCARAKLLGDRSEIADDDDTAEQYEYSSFARARAKKHQIFFSEKKKKKNTREERIQTFFSFPRTTREDEKEEKQRDKERFSSLTERGENHSFSSSAIRVSILRAITAAASVAARVYSFVVCNRACVSRASEHVYRHHYSLYIRSFCVLSLLLFGGQKFLSFSLSLSPKRQTDRHTHTLRPLE